MKCLFKILSYSTWNEACTTKTYFGFGVQLFVTVLKNNSFAGFFPLLLILVVVFIMIKLPTILRITADSCLLLFAFKWKIQDRLFFWCFFSQKVNCPNDEISFKIVEEKSISFAMNSIHIHNDFLFLAVWNWYLRSSSTKPRTWSSQKHYWSTINIIEEK